MLAGYGLLGKQAPAYVALPALPVTKANLLDAWQTRLPPAADRQDQEEHGVTRRAAGLGRAAAATAACGRAASIRTASGAVTVTKSTSRRRRRRPDDRRLASASAACARWTRSIFDVRRGEIHALLGENGAGKSTILKILNGVHAPDAGTIEVGGTPLTEHTPGGSRAAGIAMIFQEMSLVPTLTVAAEHLPRPARRATGSA